MNSNVKNQKRQRALRWLGYGLLLKLAVRRNRPADHDHPPLIISAR